MLNRLGNRDNRSDFRDRSRGRSRQPSRGRSRSRSVSFDRKNRSTSKSRNLFCNFCRRSGHTRRFCYDLKNKKKSVKFVDSPAAKPKLNEYQKSLRRRLNRSVSDDDDMDCLMISSVNRINEPCFRNVFVDGLRLKMEVDCGAAVSVISLEMYEGEFDHIPLETCDKKLAVINGSRLKVEGEITVKVEFNGQAKTDRFAKWKLIHTYVGTRLA